ncbi:MAG TPA: 4-alpha-glucanotransferase, partial [Segetibacter sp.]
SVFTHTFKIKAPLLPKNHTVCLIGSIPELGEWNPENVLLMSKAQNEDWYSVNIDLTNVEFPIAYKYGVYNTEENAFTTFEEGNNRVTFDVASPNKLTVLADGFIKLPNNTFKGAGVAIPVFSLRTDSGLGVGEFADLKILVDWAKQVGLKVIQVLPVNDTTATHTNADSYPYAAISAFALHPVYIHLPAVVNDENKHLLLSLEEKKEKFNAAEAVNYGEVMKTKFDFLKEIFPLQKQATFSTTDFNSFFTSNAHWLVPYAAFCYLRDEYGTADFSHWPSYNSFDVFEINNLATPVLTTKDEISIHYFIQYHLHLQLKSATEYAHANGVIVKGDIPIGIFRNSSDAWQQPQLFNMDMQAGAPPDDFAVRGQNWGFPTYNWQRMAEDGFSWWKNRFGQMSYYFDAFRIDHILGFFRIWSIPVHAVEGVMGYFVPSIPVHINEFNERGIWFDHYRYTKPFITDAVLLDVFGNNAEHIKTEFLSKKLNDNYELLPAFDTQRKVNDYFASLNENEINVKNREGLFNLISNVILFEVEGSQGQQYHFRIALENTSSFRFLEDGTKHKLKELYINYFYRRQDDFWMKEALQKLPELKRSTNMLICGEDLGMVPSCVPGVMKDLGILSLEIQRMPKDPSKEFFHPTNAPYLSVVTPSTHDMSTIRGWWEEDRAKTQRFYNTQLGKLGNAP